MNTVDNYEAMFKKIIEQANDALELISYNKSTNAATDICISAAYTDAARILSTLSEVCNLKELEDYAVNYPSEEF